jgi:hypothetical protein
MAQLTNEQRHYIAQMARTPGWAVLQEHLVEQRKVALNALLSVSPDDAGKIGTLQGQIKAVSNVFTFVERRIQELNKEDV